MIPKTITWQEKSELAREAMSRAVETRLDLGLELDQPFCIYAACEQLGAPVRFVDIDMEGMYRREPAPRIFISVHRPLVRRNFTCAHELGHHLFGHGTTLDETQERDSVYRDKSPEEFIADAFAAHLLMPVLGIRAAFSRRGVKSSQASPRQILAVATEFGVGYESLLNHLTFSLKDISVERKKELVNARRRLKNDLLIGQESRPIVLLDSAFRAPTLDVEINHLIVTPPGAIPDNNIVTKLDISHSSRMFLASERGAVELSIPNSPWCAIVRITSEKFIGLARYRFLDDQE